MGGGVNQEADLSFGSHYLPKVAVLRLDSGSSCLAGQALTIISSNDPKQLIQLRLVIYDISHIKHIQLLLSRKPRAPDQC